MVKVVNGEIKRKVRLVRRQKPGLYRRSKEWRRKMKMIKIFMLSMVFFLTLFFPYFPCYSQSTNLFIPVECFWIADPGLASHVIRESEGVKGISKCIECLLRNIQAQEDRIKNLEEAIGNLNLKTRRMDPIMDPTTEIEIDSKMEKMQKRMERIIEDKIEELKRR